MTPFYNGQDNHYKRMLDLQERLRKSEEERIRLEERFNILVQESRNRHQACINRLRIRYVEFLEEQRVRDERNSSILGALDKVDNSLTLITAKTERLNVLRKQYEAYLLRVYGNQQHRGGSVTADSGLDSQNDQDIPPSPVVPKFVKIVSKNAFPYINEEFSISPNSRRTSTPENENFTKFSYPKKTAAPDHQVRQNLNLKFFSQMPSLTKPAGESAEVAKTRSLLSNFSLDDSWKYPGPGSKPEAPKVNSFKPSPSLDHYIGKIKQLVHEPGQEPEFDHSVDQNTSGDLLNVTLSDDAGLESEELVEPKRIKKRETSKFTTSLTQKQPEIPSAIHVVQPEISEFPSLHRVQNQKQKPIEDALAKLASIQEVVPKTPASVPPTMTMTQLEPERQPQPESLYEEFKANVEVENVKDDEEEVEDEEGDDDTDGIEDDYDETVDIDSWMPDNSDRDEIKEVVPLPVDIRNRTRRKLEAIEEVEQPEDEESLDLAKSKEAPQKDQDSPQNISAASSQKAQSFPQTSPDATVPQKDYYGSQGAEDYPKDVTTNQEQQPEQVQPEEYNQEYYQQDATTYEHYDQNAGAQQYQYDGQSYWSGYDAQYSGYVSQQYANYEQYQYDEQQYQQQYDPSGENNETYDYTQPEQPQPEEDSLPKSEQPKENKKKDAVRAILDSDSESMIERNPSNTESDFDFN